MARDHLANITCVTDFFKHFAEPLFITAAWRGCEADQVSRNVPLEKVEVIEDAPVTGCNGMVCFIDDDYRKLFRLELRQASAIPSQRRYRGNDYFRIGAGACASLFNLHFQLRVDQMKLVARLKQQFLPMREHEQTFFHLQDIWEMREHHSFAGTCGQ